MNEKSASVVLNHKGLGVITVAQPRTMIILASLGLSTCLTQTVLRNRKKSKRRKREASRACSFVPVGGGDRERGSPSQINCRLSPKNQSLGEVLTAKEAPE